MPFYTIVAHPDGKPLAHDLTGLLFMSVPDVLSYVNGPFPYGLYLAVEIKLGENAFECAANVDKTFEIKVTRDNVLYGAMGQRGAL